VEGGESKQHSGVFTVTGLTRCRGVPTVFSWDLYYLEAHCGKKERRAKKRKKGGGEDPEEGEDGDSPGAPDTWIRGVRGAYGGIHMLPGPLLAGSTARENRFDRF